MKTTTKGADMHAIDLTQNTRYAEGLKVGQRVLAVWEGGTSREPKEAIVSQAWNGYSLYVQFQPCGAHFSVRRASAYGDANGWTDQEYRVEREKAYCQSRAANVEAERVARYPDAPFSMFRA